MGLIKTMKKKIMSILMATILLAMIPVVAGVTTTPTEPTPEPTTGLFDKTTIRGVVLFPRLTAGGQNIRFFALRLHYRTMSLNGEHYSGVVFLQPISIPNDFSGFMGKAYIFVTFKGSLNI